MLSCGRVIGCMPKLTRHTHVNHFYRPLKYVGIAHVGSLWYSSNAGNKKEYKPPGTTIKPEECIPENKYSESKKNAPVCESKPSSSCPPSCYELCDSQHPGSGKNGGPKIPMYWKLLATLIIAGVSVYAISSSDWFSTKDSSTSKDVSKKKKEGSRKRRSTKTKAPAVSSSIPKEVPYLLIGGGTAAFSAFRSIKSRDPTAKVLVITEEEDYPYMRPPLSKELWYNEERKVSAELQFKQWNGKQRSIFYEPEEFYTKVNNLLQSDKGGVAVATGWKVNKIDVANKTAILEDGYEIKYNKCLVATGLVPKTLPIFESAEDKVQDKIITFRTKDDFLELEDNVHDPKCKNIVIIGGGFLGSELACSLVHNLDESKNVYHVYKEKSVMAQVLPEYLSEWTTKKTQIEGVNCVPESEVEDFTYKNGRLSLILSNNQTIDADQVVIAVGAEPNADLAIASNLELDPETGGYLVNAELEARSDLWIAGDAACFYDVKLGRRRVEHHDHAVISGRLAGENMTGAAKPYLHQSMFWSDLGPDVAYEAIGIVDSSLPTVGVFVQGSESDTAQTVSNTSNESVQSTSTQKSTPSEVKTIVKPEVVEQKVKATDENQNTTEGEQCVDIQPTEKSEKSEKYDNFSKGVVFYLRNDIVVGIVLWNLFNRMSIARQVLARGTKYDDLNEVAKLFDIHEE